MKALFSCKEVSQFVSESLDKKSLSLWTRMRLWMHLGMCRLCYRLRRNLIRIDREVKQFAEQVECVDELTPGIPPDTRQRLQQSLGPQLRD